MNRTVARRLERLEQRAAAAGARKSFSCRIRFVDPEKGLTSVLVLESDKPALEVPPTLEEIEEVRANLERRRASRETASDIGY
jgi:hypothetical protein